MAYKLAEAFDVLLFRIYSHYTKTDAVDPFEETDVAQFVKEDDISPYVAKKALERLGSEGYVGWLEETDTYELSVSGILFVEEQLDDPTSFIATVADGSSAEAVISASSGKPLQQTDFQRLREQLLICLYRRAEKEGLNAVFDLKKIADEAGLRYRPGEIDLSARSLADSGLVREAFSMGDTDEGNHAAISPEGVEEAQELIRDALAIEDVEVAEPEWEPLPIDRRSPEYQSAVSELESTVEIISGDNGYAATQPEERDQIVWSLKEGLRAIKEHMPSRAQVNALVVQPLRYMSKKFGDTVMGVASKGAVAKIIEWLGGLV